MKGYRYIIILLAIVMSGCVTYTPPKQYDVVKTKDINQSFDVVWDKVLTFCNEKGYDIWRLDKANGIISISKPYYSSDGVIKKIDLDSLTDCDCGAIELGTVVDLKLSANITIIERLNSARATSSSTNKYVNVYINTFFPGFLHGSLQMHCSSKGIIEKELFDAIGKE